MVAVVAVVVVVAKGMTARAQCRLRKPMSQMHQPLRKLAPALSELLWFSVGLASAVKPDLKIGLAI
jgi:hypothetical protein